MVHAQALAALAFLPATVVGGNFRFPNFNVKLAQGQSTATTTYSTETKLSCSTILGPVPPIFPVLTKTLTKIVPDLFPTTVTSTSEPVVTVTAAPIQIIKSATDIVSTVVDGPIATEISKITETVVQSVISTIIPPLATTTLVIVDTSTTYTATSTIPASGNFLGVLQTGLPKLPARKREELLNMRIESEERAIRQVAKRGWIGDLFHNIWGGGNSGSNSNNSPSSNSGNGWGGGSWGNNGGNNNGGGFSPNPFFHGLPGLPDPSNWGSWNHNHYPISVTCLANVIAHKIITVVVVCATKTVTLKPQTVTKTTTTTVTSTSTRLTGTTTIPTTISTTLTNTISVTAPQNTFIATTTTTAILEQVSSYFAACSNNNLLGPTLPAIFNEVAGDVITDVLYNPQAVDLVTTDGDTAYECCRQCIQANGCTFGGWMPQGLCYLHVTKSQTCAAQSSNIGEYVVGPPPQDQTFGVYNGYCGALAYGGLADNL